MAREPEDTGDQPAGDDPFERLRQQLEARYSPEQVEDILRTIAPSTADPADGDMREDAERGSFAEDVVESPDGSTGQDLGPSP